MKLQLCLYLMVLAAVARGMNLPEEVLAVNEETFVAVDSKDNGLNGDMLSAEDATEMAAAVAPPQDSEDLDSKLHLELDLLKTVEAEEEAAEAAAEVATEEAFAADGSKLHLELDLLNAEQQAVEEQESSAVPEAGEAAPADESKLHLELDLLNAVESEAESEGHVSMEKDAGKMEFMAKPETQTQHSDEPLEETNESPEPEEKSVSVPTGNECEQEGFSAVEGDCHKYNECSKQLNDEKLTEKLVDCGPDAAFHSFYQGCRRDIGKCQDAPFNCTVDESVPDPNGNNNSYYLCQKSLADETFHLFHVHCKTGEVFLPALGKCFIDLAHFPQAYESYDWASPSEFDLVKLELAEYRVEEKKLLKLKKEEAKLLKKLQKELEKLAKKKAKEEAKAQKEAALLA